MKEDTILRITTNGSSCGDEPPVLRNTLISDREPDFVLATDYCGLNLQRINIMRNYESS